MIIGVSKPHFAKYAAENGAVSYSQGGVLGRMQSVDVTINTSTDNDIYLDNALAESERSFSDGTLTLAADTLSQAVSAAILGITPTALESIEGVSDTGAQELNYDDDQVAPDLGVGFVIKQQLRGVISWRALVLPKIKFSVPADAATTQGKSIDWQIPQLSATIMRDDSEKHAWKREATFSTESQAVAYIKHRLNIVEANA